MRPALALLAILLSLLVLESARHGVVQERWQVGETPVTTWAEPDAEGPHVVVAHGFAGSRQMMQGYALPLARAGYRVHVFDFEGHGRNPVPMSGDVTAINGTTRRLIDQTGRVIDALGAGRPVALLGHSMATDVLARLAAQRGDIGPVVLVSAYSDAVTPETPQRLLLVTGAWEVGLRDFALEVLQQVDPEAEEGETARSGDVVRRAVAAPFSEHVSVLHSRVGRREAVSWLDAAYGRDSAVTIRPTGWAILGLLAGIVMLFPSAVRRLPERPVATAGLSRRQVAVAAIAPALLAPAVAVPLDPGLLPVLVADYLALHLAVFGLAQLLLLRLWRVRLGPFDPAALGLLLAWSALFGLALDRYAANFLPTMERLWIIAALLPGTLPFMLADARLGHGASVWRRSALRGGFLASLGVAVALNPEELFFLALIAPVILLFFLVFGTMGRQASRRSGPLAPGVALALVLAWSLGVSFPLFNA
ncbi:alpha/beta hydrolase [Histidinibacterium aquaticum]|uniref:Alpha/beta hydrolase n=1 Tax=Histidinibacterium aquaticum TaxID=2613962 RepID=A0A5J5GFD8_9RHOB|nr:alpha/beta fold hydrolase [Histidinibacterium aquaticum]KAA9006956.1 alpha/beta hydrolase [Histidinibacterium aquaticum]